MARTSLSLPFSGPRLRKLRELRGWLQVDLSARTAELGRRVARERISMYETGAAKPSIRAFAVLVHALGCEQDDLLDHEAAT